MKAEIFALCDFATAEPMTGKLNLLGTFDHINTHNVPVVWPVCALAVKVRTERFEEGMKRFTIRFIDADGKTIVPAFDAQIQITLAPGESTATCQFVSTMLQLKLPNFGEYAIDLTVDGSPVASIPLYVRQIQMPPGVVPPTTPQQPTV
jgi:hypothetical protein